jgi:hypothetical protein
MLMLIVGLTLGLIYYYETLVFIGGLIGVDLLAMARDFTNMRLMKKCDDYYYMKRGLCE